MVPSCSLLSNESVLVITGVEHCAQKNVFLFNNPLFEPIWPRVSMHSIQCKIIEWSNILLGTPDEIQLATLSYVWKNITPLSIGVDMHWSYVFLFSLGASLLGLEYIRIHDQMSFTEGWLKKWGANDHRWRVKDIWYQCRNWITRVMARYLFSIFLWFTFHSRGGYLMVIFVYAYSVFIINHLWHESLVFNSYFLFFKERSP